tara:strand:+ start:2271 stop:3497 length:1227 start_codon:yes stop_codon:yes gene_type:complete
MFLDYLPSLIIGLVSLSLILYLLKKERNTASQDRDTIISLEKKLAARNQEIINLNEKIKENNISKEKEKEVLTKEFENLANKILDQNSDKFQKQNKKEIDNILLPLNQKIKEFQKTIEDVNEKDIERNASLISQITNLQRLNDKLSTNATNLANALKGDAKKQGDWGEYQLEVLLEKSGLKKEIHYHTQGGYRDEDGNLKRPDFIINLPDKKHLIVDSKVSLTAYEKYYNAEDEQERNASIKNHIDSLRNHYKGLANKDYTELYDISTPDFVLMFVPIEPALLTALNHDKNLYLEAFEKNVVIVSSSTLLATLSTVASIWKQEDQKKNAMEIAKAGGLLYDKFEGFTKDLIEIGKKIDSSKNSYSEAMGKLTEGRGNLIRQAERLKNLGVKTQKKLNQKLIDRANEDE